MKYGKKDFLTTLTGFLMAVADSVPGVSGGTIAYILGKYEDFVGSIATFSSKSSKDEKKKALGFLGKLGIGWIVGMLLSLSVIANIVTDKPYELVSLFLGFILISIPFIINEEKMFKKISIKNIITTIVGTVLVFSITSFSSSAIDLSNDTSILKYLYVFVAGMIAICAMILPGISGSTFLLIFGLYMPIVGAVKEVMKFNFASLDIALVFGVGVLIGLLYFSKFVKYLYTNYRDLVIFFVIGLMIGSIYAIIMGPTSLTDSVTGVSLGLAPLSLSNFNLIWLIAGGVIIIALEKLKHVIEGNSKK